jgi:hypothetical protein
MACVRTLQARPYGPPFYAKAAPADAPNEALLRHLTYPVRCLFFIRFSLRFARHLPRLPILLDSESREDERERRGNRGSAANGPSSPFFVKGAMVKPRSHSSVSSSATHSTNHVRLLILIGLIQVDEVSFRPVTKSRLCSTSFARVAVIAFACSSAMMALLLPPKPLSPFRLQFLYKYIH